MKQIIDRLPKQVDAALEEHARASRILATKARLLFTIIFAVSAIWMWNQQSDAKYVYLLLTAAWMVVMATGATLKRSSDSSVTAGMMIDLTIVHLGMAAFVWQGLFTTFGFGLYLCYFPILALTSHQYRTTLALRAVAYAAIGYAAISLWGGRFPWFHLAMLFTTAFVFSGGPRKPKDLVVNVAGKAVEEAFALGAKQRELDLVLRTHQFFMPPPIVDLPQIWVSSKHGAGTETSGDYFQIFETRRGPLLIVGDLSGRGFDSIGDVAEMSRCLARIVNRETSLPKILEELNGYVWERHQGVQPFTCVLARWEGEQMRYVNAGHLPMIQMSKPQAAVASYKQLPVTCGAVGARPRAVFTEEVAPFPARDQLVIYTDGVFAKIADSRDRGVAEIVALAEKFCGAEVTTLCHRIFDCAQPGYDLNKDDSTVVVIRRQPATVSAEGKAAS